MKTVQTKPQKRAQQAAITVVVTVLLSLFTLWSLITVLPIPATTLGFARFVAICLAASDLFALVVTAAGAMATKAGAPSDAKIGWRLYAISLFVAIGSIIVLGGR